VIALGTPGLVLTAGWVSWCGDLAAAGVSRRPEGGYQPGHEAGSSSGSSQGPSYEGGGARWAAL